MSSKKQKERKKKKREEVAKNRVLKRRESLRNQRKLARQEREVEMQAEEKAFGKQKPFIKNDVSVLNEVVKDMSNNKDEDIKSKIEHNLKILEALEEEYDKEAEVRKELNQKLENEGHMTIKEKMDALHKKALEIEGVSEEIAQAQKEFEDQKNEIVVEPEVTGKTLEVSSQSSVVNLENSSEEKIS